MLGFASDSQDRVLVAFYEGTRLERRTLIDRISPSFEARETFVLEDWLPDPFSETPGLQPGLEGLTGVSVPERGPVDGQTETAGLLVLADDSVIVWGYGTIARYTLP